VLPLMLNNFAGGAKSVGSSDINSPEQSRAGDFLFHCRGFSTSELASELNVSVKTIETQQMRMKEKLAANLS
jgi:hypothetical protein